MPRNRFPRSERLRSKIEIEKIFVGENKSLVAFPLRIVYGVKDADKCQESIEGASILISVPKKKFHNAVDRNRVKRQIREAWRVRKQPLLDYLAQTHQKLSLAFIYLSDELVSSQVIGKCMDRIIGKLVD